MKKVRKLISLALAMVMALAMCVTAYADEPAGTNTGTITVDNASKGETYTLVKLFDATYNDTNKAIVYKLVDGESRKVALTMLSPEMQPEWVTL